MIDRPWRIAEMLRAILQSGQRRSSLRTHQDAIRYDSQTVIDSGIFLERRTLDRMDTCLSAHAFVSSLVLSCNDSPRTSLTEGYTVNFCGDQTAVREVQVAIGYLITP